MAEKGMCERGMGKTTWELLHRVLSSADCSFSVDVRLAFEYSTRHSPCLPLSLLSLLTLAHTDFAVVLLAKVARILPPIISPG